MTLCTIQCGYCCSAESSSSHSSELKQQTVFRLSQETTSLIKVQSSFTVATQHPRRIIRMRQLANLSFKQGRGCPFPGWRVYDYILAITAWENLVTGIQDPSVLFRTKKNSGGTTLSMVNHA